jgi:hypothetical protein
MFRSRPPILRRNDNPLRPVRLEQEKAMPAEPIARLYEPDRRRPPAPPPHIPSPMKPVAASKIGKAIRPMREPSEH